MARTVIVYAVVAHQDGTFAVVRTGGDLPERVVLMFRIEQHAQRLADELNHAYMSGWHDCLIEQLAVRRREEGGGKGAARMERA